MDILQLGKEGTPRVRRGAAAPRFPRFSFFDVFWLIFALFRSALRKLSLPPLGRARLCDSDAPNQSSVA